MFPGPTSRRADRRRRRFHLGLPLLRGLYLSPEAAFLLAHGTSYILSGFVLEGDIPNSLKARV